MNPNLADGYRKKKTNKTKLLQQKSIRAKKNISLRVIEVNNLMNFIKIIFFKIFHLKNELAFLLYNIDKYRIDLFVIHKNISFTLTRLNINFTYFDRKNYNKN